MDFSAYLYLLIFVQFSLCISNNTAIDTNNIVKPNAKQEILKVLQNKHVQILENIKKNRFLNKKKKRMLKNGKKQKDTLEPDVWKQKMLLNETRRIYKGNYAKQLHYPFMASIEIFKQYQCGASIIKSDLLLTAASCLQLAWNNRYYRENPTFLKVRVGSQFVRIGGELLGVLEIYFYPTYDPKTLRNNLAIMRTHKHINLFDKKHKEVKRIEIDASENSLPINTEVLILGWGSHLPSNLGNNPVDAHLRNYILPVYTIPECQSIYGKKYVTQTNFCAGFVSSGTGNACNRDAGGPGVINGYLVGVISFGSQKCGAPDSPTVFTKVGYYYDWIEEIMEQNTTHGKKKTTPLYEPDIINRWFMTTQTGKIISKGLMEDEDTERNFYVVNITQENNFDGTQTTISDTDLEFTKPTARMHLKKLKQLEKFSQYRKPINMENDGAEIRKGQGSKKIQGAVNLHPSTSTYLVSPICTDNIRDITKHMLRQPTKPSDQRDSNGAYKQIVPIEMKNKVVPDISQTKHVTMHQTIPDSIFSNNNEPKEYFDQLKIKENKLLFPKTLREGKMKFAQRLPMNTVTDNDRVLFDQQQEFPNKQPTTYVMVPKNYARETFDSDKLSGTDGNEINVSQLSDNYSEEYFTTSDSTAESTEKDAKMIDNVGKLKQKHYKINDKSPKTFETSYERITKNSDFNANFKLFESNASFRASGGSDNNKEFSSEKTSDFNDKDISSSNPSDKLTQGEANNLIYSAKKSFDFDHKYVSSLNSSKPSAKLNQEKAVFSEKSYGQGFENTKSGNHITDVTKNQFRDEKDWSTLKAFDKSSDNNVKKPVLVANSINQNVEITNLPARLNKKSGKKSKTTHKFMRKEVTHLEPITYFHKEFLSFEKSGGSQEKGVMYFNKRARESASLSFEKGVQNQATQVQSGKYLNELNAPLRKAFKNEKLFTSKSVAKSWEYSKQNIQEVKTTTIKTTTYEIIPIENNNHNNMEESLKNLYTLDVAMAIATKQFN